MVKFSLSGLRFIQSYFSKGGPSEFATTDLSLNLTMGEAYKIKSQKSISHQSCIVASLWNNLSRERGIASEIKHDRAEDA